MINPHVCPICGAESKRGSLFKNPTCMMIRNMVQTENGLELSEKWHCAACSSNYLIRYKITSTRDSENDPLYPLGKVEIIYDAYSSIQCG